MIPVLQYTLNLKDRFYIIFKVKSYLFLKFNTNTLNTNLKEGSMLLNLDLSIVSGIKHALRKGYAAVSVIRYTATLPPLLES